MKRPLFSAIMLLACAPLPTLSVAGTDAAALRHTVELSRNWRVQPATSPVTQPILSDWGNSAGGSWKEGVSRQGTGWQSANLRDIHSIWLEQEIAVPAAWDGKSIVADFRRIEGDAIVFLNGQRVCELLRPGGEVDLTKFVRFGGSNMLRVYLTSDYTGISRGFEQDLLRYHVRTRQKLPMGDWGLGITAPVTLVARSSVAAIADVFVIPSWRKKQLDIQIEIAGTKATDGLLATAVVYDAGKNPMLTITSSTIKLSDKNKNTALTLSTAWSDPILWELDQPYLYTVKVRLETSGQVIDAVAPVSFGFREIWTEGNKLIMNGHPSRWRLTEIYGANRHGLSVYRLLGYNVGQIQPHGDLWWCGSWAPETPVIDGDLLDELDRLGMGVTLPAPSVSYLRENFHKPGVAEAYEREVAWHLKKYRNHPSILAWVVAINSYVPKSAIEPGQMGIREKAPRGQARVINDAAEIVRQHDPTRLAFAHADGNTADIATANTYLNIVPLQEREEWPLAWARQGDMPYSAVEFGAPFSANYWKGRQFLLTEYLAMYLGDQAYLGEQEKALAHTIDYALLNTSGFGKWGKVDLSMYPKYYDFLGLFVRNTNRAWRTWGVNAGWLYWLIGERYGHPTRTPDVPQYENLNYNFLAEPLAEKPAWANRNWDIFSQANSPLLVYLAGWPVFTDKTHAYHAGEKLIKQVAVVWDGAVPTTVAARWYLKDDAQDGKILASGTQEIALSPGEIRLVPFEITLPADIRRRTALSLELTTTQEGRSAGKDRFAIEVFPPIPPRPVDARLRLALHDPLGKSLGDLKKLGLAPIPWTPGCSPEDVDLLIVGREAIKPGDSLPWNDADIRVGLRVLVLEQHPLAWRSLGFETIETMPRYVFARDTASGLFAGLEPEDLINWRGSPDLLPEGEQVVPSDAPHAPKWTNRHAVASVALRTPHVAGFTPLIETEFDLAYTPLLQWRDGKGGIYFSTLDFSTRIGIDPAATLLAHNLIELAARPERTETKTVHYLGNGADEKLLRKLGLNPSDGFPGSPEKTILVAGSGFDDSLSVRLRAFAQAGGTVLHLARPGSELQANGLHVSERPVYRATPDTAIPLLRGIGPNLLRWQDALQVSVFTPDNTSTGAKVLADGLVLERKTGQGREAFLQVLPSSLENRYANDANRQEATQLSVLRLNRLVAQLITNLGATPAPDLSRRLAFSRKAPSLSTLGSWRVMGPHHGAGNRAIEILGESYPGEWVAIQGAENPNVLHRRADGVMLDWRRTVEARKDGFVDLGEVFGGARHGRVAYATRAIESERDQTVTLLLGVDYWMQAWVNGCSVIKVDEGHGTPVPNAFRANVTLKKGKNIITVKVASGSNGFGFWCQLQSNEPNPDAATRNDRQPMPDVSFYADLFHVFDPYLFTYW